MTFAWYPTRIAIMLFLFCSIDTMTMYEEEDLTCETTYSIRDVRQQSIKEMKELKNRLAYTTIGFNESNGHVPTTSGISQTNVHVNTTSGIGQTNGHMHTTNGFIGSCSTLDHFSNGTPVEKASRLCGTQHEYQISYPPSIRQTDSSNTDQVSYSRDNETLEELCGQMDSIDMSVDRNSICCVAKPTNIPQFETTFETEEVFRKDADGDTLLHIALILRESVLALAFINMALLPSYVSIKNVLCQSPLQLAVLTNLPEVVRRLVVAGAEVDCRDKDGNTPLHVACRDGKNQIMEEILEPVRYQETKQNKYEIPYQKIPQDLSIRNYEGLTVLHIAGLNNNLEAVEILIDKDVDLNMKERKAGKSVLHLACENGNINLVRLLLRHKRCNMNARTYDGSTAFDLARDRGHELICMTLAAAGARHGVDDYSDSE